MKKITVIIAILLVILTIKLKDSFSINIGSKNRSTSTTVNNSASSNTASGETTQNQSSGLETRESNDGPVSVAVTPRSLESASWDFDITLNTHSEELSEDLVAVSQLIDDQGKSFKPTAWEGAPPGGHHREGVLKFNPISPKPKSIEIKIKNVGGIQERSFKWNL